MPVKHRKEIFYWEVTFFTSKKTSSVCQQLCSFLKENQIGFQETFTAEMHVITKYLVEGNARLFPGLPFLLDKHYHKNSALPTLLSLSI